MSGKRFVFSVGIAGDVGFALTPTATDYVIGSSKSNGVECRI